MPSRPPERRLIPVHELTVDRTVQRSYTDQNRVRKMAEEYDPAALGVLEVSWRADGTKHVIDGAHRQEATLIVDPDRKLECQVHFGLSQSDEASMFRKLNNARGVNPVDRFRVRVVEGEESAVAISNVLARHGWKVQHGQSAGSFAAIAAIDRVWKGAKALSAAEAVDRVISVITTAWGHEPDGMRGEIVSGIGAVFNRHGNAVDIPKLVSELQSTQARPRGLVGQAKAAQAWRKGPLYDAMAEIVIQMLNRKRTVHRLPEWRTAA